MLEKPPQAFPVDGEGLQDGAPRFGQFFPFCFLPLVRLGRMGWQASEPLSFPKVVCGVLAETLNFSPEDLSWDHSIIIFASLDSCYAESWTVVPVFGLWRGFSSRNSLFGCTWLLVLTDLPFPFPLLRSTTAAGSYCHHPSISCLFSSCSLSPLLYSLLSS